LKGLLAKMDIHIGRFKVRRLMSELNLICKQPGPHAYKNAVAERPDIPNRLDRNFDVKQPNEVWCGDITYIWDRATLELFGSSAGPIRTPCGWLGNVGQGGCKSGDQSPGPCMGAARSPEKSDVSF
jgi:hypothetical protein